MNKKKYLLFSLLFSSIIGSMFFTGCIKDDDSSKLKAQEKQLLQAYISKNYPTASPTTDGLYFILDSAKTTSDATPASGDYLLVEYTGKLLSTGKVFGTTDSAVAQQNSLYYSQYVYGPEKMYYSSTNLIYGMYEGLSMMTEGQTATFIIPSDIGYGSYELTSIPKYSTLIFTVHLVKVIHDPVAYERTQINKFLSANTTLSTADSTSTGLYHYTKVPGSGNLIKNGDTLSVTYIGKYLDGRTFLKDTATNMTLTATPLVNYGFNEGLRYMKKGEEAVFIVPYYLGYGTSSYQVSDYVVVPPYSTLWYDVKVK